MNSDSGFGQSCNVGLPESSKKLFETCSKSVSESSGGWKFDLWKSRYLFRCNCNLGPPELRGEVDLQRLNYSVYPDFTYLVINSLKKDSLSLITVFVSIHIRKI